jgi:hypothetical protein
MKNNAKLHATAFARRSCTNIGDKDLLSKEKKEKERKLVREFPIEADIVRDILVDLLMMNG